MTTAIYLDLVFLQGNAAVFEEHTGNFYALINSGLYIHSTFWQYDNVTSERAK